MKAVLNNAEKITFPVFLILVLAVVVAGIASDKLVGPKTVERLTARAADLEKECAAKDAVADAAAKELADTRVLMAEAKVRIEWYEERFRDSVRVRDECLKQKERLELERDLRRGMMPEAGA